MGPILGSLVNLQTIEKELRSTSKRLKKCQRTVVAQQHRLEQLQMALQARRDDIMQNRKQCDILELDLKQREEDISKMRIALNSARTNKDYSIMLTSINTSKADKSKLEDRILTLISQIDALQSQQKEIEENIVTETQRLEEIRKDSQQQAAEIQKELDQLQARKEQASKAIPAKQLTLFERLSHRYDGEVLAEVQKMNNSKRSEYICGGCFMKVPLEAFNALSTKDEVQICPNCGRILVLDMNPAQQPTQ